MEVLPHVLDHKRLARRSMCRDLHAKELGVLHVRHRFLRKAKMGRSREKSR